MYTELQLESDEDACPVISVEKKQSLGRDAFSPSMGSDLGSWLVSDRDDPFRAVREWLSFSVKVNALQSASPRSPKEAIELDLEHEKGVILENSMGNEALDVSDFAETPDATGFGNDLVSALSEIRRLRKQIVIIEEDLVVERHRAEVSASDLMRVKATLAGVKRHNETLTEDLQSALENNEKLERELQEERQRMDGVDKHNLQLGFKIAKLEARLKAKDEAMLWMENQLKELIEYSSNVEKLQVENEELQGKLFFLELKMGRFKVQIRQELACKVEAEEKIKHLEDKVSASAAIEESYKIKISELESSCKKVQEKADQAVRDSKLLKDEVVKAKAASRGAAAANSNGSNTLHHKSASLPGHHQKSRSEHSLPPVMPDSHGHDENGAPGEEPLRKPVHRKQLAHAKPVGVAELRLSTKVQEFQLNHQYNAHHHRSLSAQQ
eukprot:TRINITY_DN666_c0_g1_i3.p1 TRINITY_DN666_c0_g1~~TRINITY_DN666_c0_g1_i3.p1  ORF type:complete len:440 (-),score=116.46 TRINITY_DN666_c0_g1_i3:189-1508(-)